MELDTDPNRLLLLFELGNILLLLFFMFPVNCFFEAVSRYKGNHVSKIKKKVSKLAKLNLTKFYQGSKKM